MGLSLQELPVRTQPMESLLEASTLPPAKHSYSGIQSTGSSGQGLASPHHSLLCSAQWERCGIVQGSKIPGVSDLGLKAGCTTAILFVSQFKPAK